MKLWCVLWFRTVLCFCSFAAAPLLKHTTAHTDARWQAKKQNFCGHLFKEQIKCFLIFQNLDCYSRWFCILEFIVNSAILIVGTYYNKKYFHLAKEKSFSFCLRQLHEKKLVLRNSPHFDFDDKTASIFLFFVWNFWAFGNSQLRRQNNGAVTRSNFWP